jgi:hypothetical protein
MTFSEPCAQRGVKPMDGRGMSRTGLAIVVVGLVVLIGVMLSRRLPAPAGNGQARRCEIPAETPRALHLDRFADRAHLRADSATAESWALAYADVSPLRQQGPGPYAEVGNQCMAMLFTKISKNHGIDASTVREYAQQRDVIFDSAVLLLFALAYVGVAYRLVGVVTDRVSNDERFALVAAIIFASLMVAFAALLIGDIWAIAAEVLRVGNGHLGYRTERLPWRQHRPAIMVTGLALFWLVAAIRIASPKGFLSSFFGESISDFATKKKPHA